MKMPMIAAALVMVWSGAALAGTTTRAGSFELMGKRICFADAPASTHCDYRYHRLATPKPDSRAVSNDRTAAEDGVRFRLWGAEYCFGDAAGGTGCDYNIGAPHRGKSFTFLGVRVCLGSPPHAESCNVRIPLSERPTEAHARRW
jgi:hypothetical protein